jgi:uncharacterized protein YabE (DUF348 family)
MGSSGGGATVARIASYRITEGHRQVGQESPHNPPSLARGLITLATLLMIGGVAAGYGAGLASVTLVVDGEADQMRTHQRTVGALLMDAGLELHPEDIVMPPPDEPLTPDMTVEVTRARPVVIEADGRRWHVRSHASTSERILAEAGLQVGPHDRVTAEEVNRPGEEPHLHLRVQRAVPVTIHQDGSTVVLHTTATTVGDALLEAGLVLYLADRVEPEPGEVLSAGMHIYVERSQPVTVQVDGRTLRTRTHREQVGEVLADLRVALTGKDYTRPSSSHPITDETTIEVVRVNERFLIQQEPIPFEVVWQPDPELELDHQRLIQDGAPGVLERRLRVRNENGQEVSRTLENEYVLTPPTTKVFGYGTRIVVREIETSEGTVEYWRVIRMLATSYSASTAGTSPDSPWYGRTRLGWQMRHGIVAVDPRVIPLRTRVYVPGYGIGVAGDTGGAINGRRIDLGYDDSNLVLWYRWVDVYLLTPVPPPSQIDYVLEGR